MKKKILLSLLIFALMITITGCGKTGKNNSRENEDYNEAFFIKDSGKYALFSNSGKQLTDFAFTRVNEFVNGSALVKTDTAEGIIGTNGKMIVDFGVYKYMYDKAGLYEVTDNENNTYLIDSKGKKIVDMKQKSLFTYISENKYSLLLDKAANEYTLLNSNGEGLVKFEKVDGTDNPLVKENTGFVSASYNGKTYVVDLIENKKVIDFEATENYCINGASEDGKIITLNSCVATFAKQDEVKYKFIKNGKLYDFSDSCDRVLYAYENLICIKNSVKYIIDSDMKVGISIENASYSDDTHYAKKADGSFNGVNFYEKDTLVKNVPCRTMHEYSYSKSGLFILNTYYSKSCGTQSGTYEFYNTKGEKQFDKSFAYAKQFDNNGLAIVGVDKNSLYLIDTTGKQISETYENIYAKEEYYLVVNNKSYGMIDVKGKVILEPIYSQIEILTKNGKKYAKLTTSDSKTIIYDLEAKKEIISFDVAVSTNNKNYLTIQKDGKTIYYTYTGKEIYITK